MMNRICGLFAGAVIALVCGGVVGCYDDPCDDMEYSWAGETEKKIVGFVNDSFAIVAHANKWSYEAGCMCSGERFGLGRWTIGIYNYREQLDGPVFVDSVDEGFGYYTYILGQLSDSVVWGGNTAMNLTVWKNATSFSFWKIGEQPHVIGVRPSFDGCSVSFPIGSLREWSDGTIFAKGNLVAGSDSCQYAVLDTVSGVLTYKRLDEDLMWIQNCDDVRTWGKDVFCLERKKENFSTRLLKNGFPIDSLLVEGQKKYAVYPALFVGQMIRLGDYICSIDKERMKMDPNIRFLSGLKFIDSNEKEISY